MHYAFVASFVALAVFATALPQSVGKRDGFSIPLTKRSRILNVDKSVSFGALSSHVASAEAKILRGFERYKKNTGIPHPSAPKAGQSHKHGAGEPLTDYVSEYWYGAVSVGTPQQHFTVNFDTGSSDFFVPSTSCDSSCDGHVLYSPASSSTSNDLGVFFILEYGDGSTALGEQYKDSVDLVGYTANNQTLGAASYLSSGFQISQSPSDGLMGMGFQSISTYGANPVFQTLVSEGHVADPVFSFKLSSSGGELYIGGPDSTQYTGDLSFTPVTVQGFWEVNVDSVQGNGQTVLRDIDSIIDTGTTLVLGNAWEVSALYSVLEPTAVENIDGTTYYAFPCDSFPTISFTFRGATFDITSDAINIGQANVSSSDCYSGLVGVDGISTWIIGDVFLQGVYTAFDIGNSQVGFAKLA